MLTLFVMEMIPMIMCRRKLSMQAELVLTLHRQSPLEHDCCRTMSSRLVSLVQQDKPQTHQSCLQPSQDPRHRPCKKNTSHVAHIPTRLIRSCYCAKKFVVRLSYPDRHVFTVPLKRKRRSPSTDRRPRLSARHMFLNPFGLSEGSPTPRLKSPRSYRHSRVLHNESRR